MIRYSEFSLAQIAKTKGDTKEERRRVRGIGDGAVRDARTSMT